MVMDASLCIDPHSQKALIWGLSLQCSEIGLVRISRDEKNKKEGKEESTGG
jgi:hypothetical protein